MRLEPISETRLTGVHPDLVRVVRRAADMMSDDLRFRVTEGLRTIERQRKLVASGASRTLNSRHLTGHAIDVAAMVDLDGDGAWEVRWDWPLYARLASFFAIAADAESVPIVWGGSWPTFRDGPHFELLRRVYP